MIIYNVTTSVEHSITAAWLQWMKSTHIPDIVDTGCFSHAVILELLEVDTTEALTYAVQFHAPDDSSYNRFITEFSAQMQAVEQATWGEKTVSFRSALRVVADV